MPTPNSSIKKIVSRAKTNVMYVGNERRDSINQRAVLITQKTNIPVNPGDFLQFLIDHYADMAEIEMVRQLQSKD
ncbi:hypothetical protein [Enterobacter hormaechei]|jgi:CO dehydrogenase/acetyl-CoA synthase epsilon subunit|uniref:hypothetical protein n=1 Tax=Enterobacter hormaechei TaxID=158836 RepID=UPI00298A7A6D|nr:hypothetical protein [Salmonella enterica]